MGLGAQRAKPVGWVSFSPSPDYARCPETHTEGSISPKGTGAASQPRSVRPCVSAHLPAVSPPFQLPASLPPNLFSGSRTCRPVREDVGHVGQEEESF